MYYLSTSNQETIFSDIKNICKKFKRMLSSSNADSRALEETADNASMQKLTAKMSYKR